MIADLAYRLLSRFSKEQVPPGVACGHRILTCSGELITELRMPRPDRGRTMLAPSPLTWCMSVFRPTSSACCPGYRGAHGATVSSGTRPARTCHGMCGPSNAVLRLCRKPRAEGDKSRPSAPFRLGHACKRTAECHPRPLGRHRANGHRQAVKERDMRHLHHAGSGLGRLVIYLYVDARKRCPNIGAQGNM